MCPDNLPRIRDINSLVIEIRRELPTRPLKQELEALHVERIKLQRRIELNRGSEDKLKKLNQEIDELGKTAPYSKKKERDELQNLVDVPRIALHEVNFKIEFFSKCQSTKG